MQLRLHLNMILQNILVAHLLDLQIAAHMHLFLPQGNDIPPFAQRAAEEVGQAGHHLHRLIVFAGFHQPDDGIQCVIQKMRVDLGLQQRQLHGAQLILLLPDQLHLFAEVRRHLLNTVAQRLQRVVLRLHRLVHRQIAVTDRLGTVAQRVDGLGDAAAELACLPRHHRQQRCRRHHHTSQLCPQPHGQRVLQRVEIARFVIQIFIKILLHQLGQDVHIGFQLFHPCVVSGGFRNIHNAVAERFAQIDGAFDRFAAVAVAGVRQQLLRQHARFLDLLQRQRLPIVAAGNIVVHLQIDILAEILVKLRGAHNVGGHACVLIIVDKQHRQRADDRRTHQQQHAPQQPSQPHIQRFGRLTVPLHARLRFPPGSCWACSPAFF